MEKVNKVLWTKNTIDSLEKIYNFHRHKSEISALRIIDEILETADSISIAKQYQVDDINPNYRRMIVGHHKVLYKEENNTVWIAHVVDSRQSPKGIAKL